MRSLIIGMASTVLAFGWMGCTNPSASQAQTPNPQVVQTETVPTQQKADNTATDKDEKAVQAKNDKSNTKSIVVYYSRTGENYSVGNITVGNTAKVAAEIAKQTGADLFEIKPVKSYPANYKKCIEVAQQEKENNVRPQIATTVEHFEQYNTVYLGYPNWWGDMPMIVYTFIESQNFDGKTVIPFVTHEGSGLSGTPQKLRKALPKATVTNGIAITGSTAQNKPDEVTKKVSELIKQAPKD